MTVTLLFSVPFVSRHSRSIPSSLSSPRRETDRVAFPSVTPPYGVYVMRETRKGTYEHEILCLKVQQIMVFYNFKFLTATEP